MKMNLPNKLTVLRMIMVPIFMIVMAIPELIEIGTTAHTICNIAGVVLFIAASLTDMLDGKIARKYGLVTNFGKFMDPLADKLLVCSILICCTALDLTPAWAVIIVIAREFAISGFRLVAVEKGVVIAADWSGKVKTASTMVSLCFWMAFPGVVWLSWVIITVIVVTTIYSGIEYFVQNWKCLWD